MRFVNLGIAFGLALALGGCSRDMDAEYPEHCRDSTGDDVEQAARVTGQGVEAGVETGVAGIKQAGKATGGLVTGGTDKAEQEWEEGKAETRQEAAEGRAEVAQAQLPECPPR